MSRNNNVFQVLVTSGNQAVLAVDNGVTDLLPGQIGVFDFNTNLSIGPATTSRNFYLAVGLDKDNDGNTDDVSKSRGSYIQSRNVNNYSYRPHTAGRPMKVVLKDYTAECETEYGIKLELRNQEIYRTQGYNQFTKTYSTVTSCCDGCAPTCPSGDGNEITKLLKININNDESGLVSAIAIARQALVKATIDAAVVGTPFSGDLALGDEVSDADLLVLMEYNAAQADVADYVYTDLEITTVTQKINSFCDVNLQYFYPRQTFVIASKIGEGFKCAGTVETSQTAVFEEGSGYDVKQLEYLTIGWDQSPYRLSTLNGVADSKTYNAVEATKYDQIVLDYDRVHESAFQQYQDAEGTVIAVPAPDTITRNALAVILDAVVAVPNGFDPKADDAAAASVDPAVIEATEDKGADLDGIG